jgi:hypothetical protein
LWFSGLSASASPREKVPVAAEGSEAGLGLLCGFRDNLAERLLTWRGTDCTLTLIWAGLMQAGHHSVSVGLKSIYKCNEPATTD